MANITKTVIFPVPTEWLGQNQSSSTVGIATYEGPEKLRIDWIKDSNPPVSDRVNDPASKDAEVPVALDCIQTELDCAKYPLHAINFWGQKEDPQRIVINVGPADVDNPEITDPQDFIEVFDPASFYYDQSSSTWSTPAFKNDGDKTAIGSTEGVNFGWDWVRETRTFLLSGCDSRLSEDMPDQVKNEWKVYRQRLRDIPTDWVGVGSATHLIQWPLDPDQVGAGKTWGKNTTDPFGPSADNLG